LETLRPFLNVRFCIALRLRRDILPYVVRPLLIILAHWLKNEGGSKLSKTYLTNDKDFLLCAILFNLPLVADSTLASGHKMIQGNVFLELK
jgi:hypothetical protein